MSPSHISTLSRAGSPAGSFRGGAMDIDHFVGPNDGISSAGKKVKVLSVREVADMMLPNNEVLHPTHRPAVREHSVESEDLFVESIEAEDSIENAIQSVGWPSQAAPLDECLSDDDCGREVTPTPDVEEFRRPYMPAKSIYEKQPFIIKEIVNLQGRFADTPITFTSDHRTPPISLVKQHELKKQAALEAEQKAAMDKKALEISSFGFDSPASGRKRKRASCKDAQRILRGKATPYSYGKYTIKPEHNAFTNLGRLSRTGNLPSLRKSCQFFMRNGTYILVLHDGTEMENPDLTFLPDGFYATLYANVKELTAKTESGIKAKRGTKVLVQVDGSELKVENHDNADVAAEAEADADVEMKELGDSSLYNGTDLYEA